MNTSELKYVLLIFGIIFLVVFLVRKAVKKVVSDRGNKVKPEKTQAKVEKPKLTEEQFNRSWKALSFLLLVAAAGNLYMVYVAVRNGLQPSGLWVWWVDAAFSLLAAIVVLFIWLKRTKLWVFGYFVLTLIPIFLFMSIKGTNYKISAMIHLFPLVLLYLVLQPIWSSMKE